MHTSRLDDTLLYLSSNSVCAKLIRTCFLQALFIQQVLSITCWVWALSKHIPFKFFKIFCLLIVYLSCRTAEEEEEDDDDEEEEEETQQENAQAISKENDAREADKKRANAQLSD